MYSMYLDVDDQCIKVARQGRVIASRQLPTRVTPPMGRDALLHFPGNQEAYDLIHDLIVDANDGCGEK